MSDKRLPWFRMYVDFLNDPKMIALAFEDQRHFIGLLALKSDGALDVDIDEALLDRIVAQRLWIDHAVIREVKKRLVAGGLIDKHWQPLAWNKRQMHSDKDPTGAERQRRFRDRQKLNDAGDAADPPVEPGDPNPPKVKIPAKERQITLATYLAACKERGAKPVPDDHPIRKYMQDTGITDEMGQIAWLRFRDEHITGQRKTKKYIDWPAAFANSVKARWYRLWNVGLDGEATWTSEGLQEKRAVEARRNEKEIA